MTTAARLKHQRISALLEREIRSGRMTRGTRLPGELSLARRFGVSRTTVRAALAELSEAGLITTRMGKGSFVLFDGRPLDNRLGWARALAGHGVEMTVRVIGVTAQRNEELAARLRLDSPEVVVIERVREVGGGKAVSYERSHVPAIDGLRELPAEGLPGGSLTTAMERAGLRVDHGEQRVKGRRIDEHEAAVLGREPGTWFLNTRRTSWTAQGAFVECVDSLLDPEHFELSVPFGEGEDAV